MPGHYLWTPPTEVVERANVTRLMRRHGIADYRELVARSTRDLEWFWGAVIEDLDIAFARPYDAILDASGGIPWCRWFVGGSINLADHCLDRHARSSRRDRIAVVWEGEDGTVRRLTYGELHAQTCRLAGALERLGIQQGDRVGLFLPMVPEAVVAFLACAWIGAVAIPIFSGFGAAAVAARLHDGQAVALITTDVSYRRGKALPLEPVARAAADACPSVRHVIFTRSQRGAGTADSPRDRRFLDWEELVAGEPATGPARPLDPEAPLMIMYTSGTTGRPKGAVHVHGGFLVKIAQEVAHQVDMGQDDVLHWVTDLGWIMGPWELVGGLAAGGTIVLAEGVPDYPAPDRLWALVARQGVTILGVSPTLIRALIKYGSDPIRSHDLTGLRILASTGEPWDPESWRWLFENVGAGRLPIINLTGGTEVGACLLSAVPITPLKPCSLVGPALGMAVDVYDPDGRPLRQGVGELVCTRPWPAMTRGIWGDPERYLATYWSRWPDTWVHGDWASIDEDGDWFLHGRSDDTIKVAGKRLGPAEIESILAQHDAVAESAAVGIPDSVKGEAILCFVVPRAGYPASDRLRSELRALVAAALGKSFVPAGIHFVAELPKTRSGKILRRVIQRVATGLDPGDLSTIESLAAIDAIRAAQ
ncbi:MAG TPA: AMP-binding protein [Isosphaeraceae bacterium]|nr:AMP-binding protein [Isosphaeraceae bacterium]